MKEKENTRAAGLIEAAELLESMSEESLKRVPSWFAVKMLAEILRKKAETE